MHQTTGTQSSDNSRKGASNEWHCWLSSDPADDHTTEYEWDERNRLMTVTFKDNAGQVTKSVEYVYDMFNQRIGKQVFDAGITLVKNERYVWNDGNVALDFSDYDLDGTAEEDELSKRYLWGQRVDEFFGQENIEQILGDSVVNWAK